MQKHSPTTSHRQTNAQPVSQKLLLPCPSPSCCWVWWCVVWDTLSLVSGAHLSQLCSLPLCLVLTTPRLLAGVEWEPEKVLMLCKHWSAVAKVLLCCQHCFITNTKHCTIWAATKKINFIPARLNIASWQDMHKDWWTHIYIMCVSIRLIFLCTLD